MSGEPNAPSIDLVRWTFTVDPAHRAEVESHLIDLGLDVLVREDRYFLVTWDEPDRPVEEVIEELWEITGEAFEVTHEEFHRTGLHTLHHEETEAAA
jgi:hypothetical protein